MRHFLFAFVLSGCAFVNGSGHIIHEDRAVPEFHAVTVRDDLRGTIAIGPTQVALDLDDNVMPHVHTVVSGSTLDVGPDESLDVDPSEASTIALASPIIDSISISGHSTISATANQPNVYLEATGQSALGVSTASDTVSVITSGGSAVSVDGHATSVDANASGGSKVMTNGLDATSAHVYASGNSEVTVRASRRVVVRASGGSHVIVIGNASERDVDASDSSTVTFE